MYKLFQHKTDRSVFFFVRLCKINRQKLKSNHKMMTKVYYRRKETKGLSMFYREAGNIEKPTIVLLHGFPTSSHMYRKIIEQAGDDYHVIAPDYPGFGESDFPNPNEFEYSFDNIASYVEELLEALKVDRYAIMIQDYGAPIGFRLAVKNPEKIIGIINQNGNAYEEGLGDAWEGIRALWKERNQETEKALLGAFTLEGLKWQYTHGTQHPENINPDTWNLDFVKMERPHAHKQHLDLFYDYRRNLELYPVWQEYLKQHQPPLLIVWGKNDAFFPESGAQAFLKDVAKVDYNVYDTGHFALEEYGDEILLKIKDFVKEL